MARFIHELRGSGSVPDGAANASAATVKAGSNGQSPYISGAERARECALLRTLLPHVFRLRFVGVSRASLPHVTSLCKTDTPRSMLLRE
jgi:hypothetical protein